MDPEVTRIVQESRRRHVSPGGSLRCVIAGLAVLLTLAGPATAGTTVTGGATGGITGPVLCPNCASGVICTQPVPCGTSVTPAGGGIVLQNCGGSTLIISSVSVVGDSLPDFSVGALPCPTLAPGVVCVVPVTFTPQAAGPRLAALRIDSNASPSPYFLPLFGVGGGPCGCSIALSSTSLDFGMVAIGQQSSSQSLTVTNNGSTDVTLLGSSGANPADFIVAPNPAGLILHPGQSITFAVTFRPTSGSATSRSAFLTVTAAGSAQPCTVSATLSGTIPGVVSGAQCSLQPTSWNFGTIGGSKSFTLTNVGGTQLVVNAPTLTGSTSFVITGDTGLGQTIFLQPGQTRTITVTFTPPNTGLPVSATLSLNTSAGFCSSTLSGSPPVQLACTLMVTVPAFAVVCPATSNTQTVTITNNAGSGPATLGSITTVGPNAAEFKITGDSGQTVLGAGQSRLLQITFTPAASGTHMASLQVSSSCLGSPQLFSLTGTAALAGTLSVNPTSLVFPSQLGGVPSVKSVTITNTGAVSVPVSFSVSGANASDFTVVSDTGPAVVPPNGTRTLGIQFTPMGQGGRSAALVINGGAPCGVTLPLSGTGSGCAQIEAMASIVTVTNGVKTSSDQVAVNVGGCVTLQLLVSRNGGTPVDLTQDPNTRFLTNPVRGTFTAKNVWCALAADANHEFPIYVIYHDACSGTDITDTIHVHVNP